MDLPGILKKYWYIPLLFLYLISAYQKYKTEGISAFAVPAGISLLTAIIQTTYNNIRPIKRTIRRLKYFIGYSNFSWDIEAKFLIRSVNKVSDQDEEIRKVIKTVLEENGIKVPMQEIELSRDNLNRIKIYISPLFMYTSIDFTDFESTDDEGFALEWMSMRFKTTLRYKKIRKTINDFLIDLFKTLEKKYEVADVKYSMKIDLEGRNKDFYKDQFIKDLDPKDVDTFSIMIKGARSTQMITHRNVSITTSRTEELVVAVDNLILRLN